MKKYGVIGFPLGHSMSPFIQKELFALRGTEAEYEKYEIAPEKLSEEFSKTLSKLDGFNITIPHKIAIMSCCDEIDGVAAEYGAVNTVVKRDGRFFGYNTDAYGFLKGLEFSDIPLEGKVLVYGFGGAARTLITESLKAGCEVTVGTTADRLAQAEKVVAEIAAKKGKKIKLISNEEITENFDLLVHASPVGMYPKVGVSPITAEQVELFRCVYDIVYNPTDTELLKTAREKGKICGGGLSMLVYQAMRGQTHGLGVEFTKEEAATVIERSAKELERVFGK